MGAVTFYFGTMNCGKSTLALQMAHNARAAGQSVLLFSKLDRAGAVISSRIGLSQPATTVGDDLDLHHHVVGCIEAGGPVDELIVDEAQFLSPSQVDQLARLADERDLQVRCFGLLSDFQTRLFPGSQRLLELADQREELQLAARCWCGERGTHNARTLRGRIVRDGAQVVVGDVDDSAVAYEVLCRHHHREGITRRTADTPEDVGGATATASPVPAERARPAPTSSRQK
ncbi:thymidine kinase [Salsipaludibacter albus]|uniref:thymidine kinase n=1 Tax=Salsipaludibacter albus TaxID=2849650 RepID=UPI001EE414E3|nr:thymidine kinase [Salsipaludibacter albus]MBY5161124.1 thymidine kinase [Salsipaludibacter albus]